LPKDLSSAGVVKKSSGVVWGGQCSGICLEVDVDGDDDAVGVYPALSLWKRCVSEA